GGGGPAAGAILAPGRRLRPAVLDLQPEAAAGLRVDPHAGAVADATRDDLLRQRRLHLLLDGALQRPRPVDGIVAPVGQIVSGRLAELEGEMPVGEPQL